ncbi:hypothetical protein CCP2SC5_1010003 [Azospirillaceae bacterium]
MVSPTREDAMKKPTFSIINPDNINDPTCRKGVIKARYADLIATFGRPSNNNGYKTQAEWWVRFEDGVIASIYDYKFEGVSLEQNTDWHVGGHIRDRAAQAVHNVLKVLGKKAKLTDIES